MIERHSRLTAPVINLKAINKTLSPRLAELFDRGAKLEIATCRSQFRVVVNFYCDCHRDKISAISRPALASIGAISGDDRNKCNYANLK